MTHNLKILSFGLLCAVLFTAGCNTYFQVPPSSTLESAVDPEPYLGDWSLESIDGEPVKYKDELVIRINQGDNETLQLIDPTDGSVNEVFEATKIGQTVVVSSRKIYSEKEKHLEGDRRWKLFAVELRDNGNHLIVQDISFMQVKKDIEQGNLPGEVIEWDIQDYLIYVNTTDKQLRTYLENHPNIFDGGVLTFVRQVD